MFQIDVMSRVPVYEQIINQTKRFVLSGVLVCGDQLPTVRQLSADLSVNPNTIAKAFKEMERQGLTFSAPGKGSFISPIAGEILAKEARGELGNFERRVQELAYAGIGRNEMLAIINQGSAYTEKKAGAEYVG